MWSCITLYNRPQVCFTPDLQPEWLLALICIFIGCICITTTVILLASSHFDRNVIPYARWVGFAASKFLRFTQFLKNVKSIYHSICSTVALLLPINFCKYDQIQTFIHIVKKNFFSGCVLPSSSYISYGIPCRRDWWPAIPIAQ